jgi:prepilin peptidase CpaA
MTISALAAVCGVFLFPLAMIFAGLMDLATMKIRNVLVAAIGLAWLALAPLAGFSLQEMGQNFGVALIVLVLTFFFFARGWIGGGDAKLAASTALWLGFDYLFVYALYASLFGGILTFALIRFRFLPLPPTLEGQEWLKRLHDANSGIPYGIALAAAALMVYPHTPWMKIFG